MRYLFVFLLLSMGFWAPVRGESEPGLTLVELIDIALKNNPETEKVWSSVKRAQAAVGIVRSADYPQFNAQGTLTHAREVKYPNGPDTIFTSGGGELNLNYLLCDFGETRAAVRAAKEALAASKWWADFAMQKVMAEVSANYYELLNARELLETKESSLADARVILDAAGELRQAGLRSENDYITVKAKVSEILMQLAQQKASAAIAYGKLITSLGVPMETKLDVHTKPEGIQNPLFKEGIEALLEIARVQRADLLAQQAVVAEKNARVSRAKRAPLPKLRALGQAGWLEYTKHQGSGYNYSAGVALDIPVFRGFEYTFQKKQAIADAEVSTAELKELQNAVALEVLSYSETVKASSEAMQYSEEFFAEALKSYENSLEGYKAGLISVFDLLQAQGNLADARNRKAQAKTVWLVSLSQLAFAIGGK